MNIEPVSSSQWKWKCELCKQDFTIRYYIQRNAKMNYCVEQSEQYKKNVFPYTTQKLPVTSGNMILYHLKKSWCKKNCMTKIRCCTQCV